MTWRSQPSAEAVSQLPHVPAVSGRQALALLLGLGASGESEAYLPDKVLYGARECYLWHFRCDTLGLREKTLWPECGSALTGCTTLSFWGRCWGTSAKCPDVQWPAPQFIHGIPLGCVLSHRGSWTFFYHSISTWWLLFLSSKFTELLPLVSQPHGCKNAFRISPPALQRVARVWG